MSNLSKHEKSLEVAEKKEIVEEKKITNATPEKKELEKEADGASKPKPSKGGEKKKPMWALTAQQAEELKEQEVDELVEFAYQLDYEKFVEDFEVRQALSVLRERVSELKKDDKWKENFVDKWNKENPNLKPEEVKEGGEAKEPNADANADKQDTQSVKSHSNINLAKHI